MILHTYLKQQNSLEPQIVNLSRKLELELKMNTLNHKSISCTQDRTWWAESTSEDSDILTSERPWYPYLVHIAGLSFSHRRWHNNILEKEFSTIKLLWIQRTSKYRKMYLMKSLELKMPPPWTIFSCERLALIIHHWHSGSLYLSVSASFSFPHHLYLCPFHTKIVKRYWFQRHVNLVCVSWSNAFILLVFAAY